MDARLRGHDGAVLEFLTKSEHLQNVILSRRRRIYILQQEPGPNIEERNTVKNFRPFAVAQGDNEKTLVAYDGSLTLGYIRSV